ncbi:MAG: SHOCT domain-containing protein [Thermoplasmata archaeon]
MTNNISRFIVPLVIVQFFLLAVQFIIGMWINLFAPMNIPTTQYNGMMGSYLMDIMIQIPEIMAHMMVGILIGLVALITLFVSIFTGKFTIILLVAINGILTLMAGIYGITFLIGGMQNNILSFIMSIGFIGVVLSDFGIIYFIDRMDTPASKTNSNAIATLRERYAKGEITKDQFDKIMEDLEK